MYTHHNAQGIDFTFIIIELVFTNYFLARLNYNEEKLLKYLTNYLFFIAHCFIAEVLYTASWMQSLSKQNIKQMPYHHPLGLLILFSQLRASVSHLPVKNLGLTVHISMCSVCFLVVTEEKSNDNKHLWIQYLPWGGGGHGMGAWTTQMHYYTC